MQQYYPQQQQQGVYHPAQAYHSPSSSLDGVTPSAAGTGSMSPSGSYYTHLPPADPHFVQQSGQFPAIAWGPGVQPTGAGTGTAGVGRGPSLSSTNSSSRPTHTTSSGVYAPIGAGAAAKEREAFGAAALPPPRPLGLGVANPDLGEASASTVGVDREAYLRNGPGPIVHQDAGRVDPVEAEEEAEAREEIPPTYDSLPAEERR